MPWLKAMAGGGASRVRSNHPAPASASAAPPYPRRGAFSGTYVAVFSSILGNDRRLLAERFDEFFSLLEIRGASFALGGGPMGHHHILIRVLPSCGQSKSSSAGRIKLFIDHACRAAFQDTFDVC
jgi:hypothetical protein